MRGHRELLAFREERGWITPDEERDLKAAFLTTDKHIRRVLDDLRRENVSVDEGRKRLEELKSALEIEHFYRDNREGLDFFFKQTDGPEEIEEITSMLKRDAADYLKDCENKGIVETLRPEIWFRETLPVLEKYYLADMKEICADEDKNKRAFRAILMKISNTEGSHV